MVLKSFVAIHKQFKQLKENKHMRIICADDSYLNLEALRVVFQRLGLIDYCVFVSNGQQAIESCIKNVNEITYGQDSITIIILDYEMPFHTGLQVIAEVKAFYNQTNFVD
jgi:CheY-like chemotaxis protein